MNCRNCNAVIDYIYVTECPQCGCVVEEGDLPKLDPSGKTKRVWPYHLVNVVYVLVTSAVGMISGAVVIYFSAAVLYIAFASAETYPGENCARGTAIGVLAILIGGFLGTVGGTAFAIKHPLMKQSIEDQVNA